MTKYEKFVVSAYTGVNLVKNDDWFEFLDFIAKKLGRTKICVHELIDEDVQEELKKVVKQEFLNIYNS